MKQLNQKTAYWLYCIANSENLKFGITPEQMEDIHATYFGVIDLSGKETTGQRIDELSPIPEAKNDNEILERWTSIHTCLVHQGVCINFSEEDFLKLYPSHNEWNDQMIKDMIIQNGEDNLLGPITIEEHRDWFLRMYEKSKELMIKRHTV